MCLKIKCIENENATRNSVSWILFDLRTLFTEMRMTVEHFTATPSCPGIIRTACLKAIAFISRLSPPNPSVTPHWPLVIVCVSVVNCADCDTERLQVDVWRRSQCYKTEKHLSVLNFILLRGIDLMQIWL